jgi:hypothetical protein
MQQAHMKDYKAKIQTSVISNIINLLNKLNLFLALPYHDSSAQLFRVSHTHNNVPGWLSRKKTGHSRPTTEPTLYNTKQQAQLTLSDLASNSQEKIQTKQCRAKRVALTNALCGHNQGFYKPGIYEWTSQAAGGSASLDNTLLTSH